MVTKLKDIVAINTDAVAVVDGTIQWHFCVKC